MAMFFCSSSFSSLRNVMCVGMSSSRSSGVSGVACRQHRKVQSFFIPKAGRTSQKFLDELPAQFLAGRFVLHELIFKTHSVLDGRLSLLGDKLGAVLDSFRERPFRDQGIDEATTERLGRTLKRTQRNAPAASDCSSSTIRGWDTPRRRPNCLVVIPSASPSPGANLWVDAGLLSNGRRVAKRLSRWRMASFMR